VTGFSPARNAGWSLFSVRPSNISFGSGISSTIPSAAENAEPSKDEAVPRQALRRLSPVRPAGLRPLFPSSPGRAGRSCAVFALRSDCPESESRSILLSVGHVIARSLVRSQSCLQSGTQPKPETVHGLARLDPRRSVIAPRRFWESLRAEGSHGRPRA
jgi:hypothetical protein